MTDKNKKSSDGADAPSEAIHYETEFYCNLDRTDSSILNWAKFYVFELGWSVLPLPYQKKYPPCMDSWKEFQDRLPTAKELKTWFQDKCRNIAVITGYPFGPDVVDLDSKEAVNRADGWEILGGPKSTTRNGYHVLFRPDEGRRNFQNKKDDPVLNKIDLRAIGGYIVVQPSIHPSGFQYRWNCELETLKDLPEFPKVLKEKLKKTQKIACVKRGVLEGHSHNTQKQSNLKFSTYLTAHKLNLDWKSQTKAMCFRGHDKDSPSLSFKIDEDYFQCFGCGIAGDAVSLVKAYFGIDYKEAVQWLLTN